MNSGAVRGEARKIGETHCDGVAAPGARSEPIHIANGGELIIFFKKFPAKRQNVGKNEMPLLNVLRDTFGDDDPTIDRLRHSTSDIHSLSLRRFPGRAPASDRTFLFSPEL